MTSFEFDPGSVALSAATCPKCGKNGKLVDASAVDCNGEGVEPPDPNKTSSQIYCMYYAITNAQSNDISPAAAQKEAMVKAVQETKSLREEWPLAYDDDEWAPVLAEYYGFKSLASGITYDKIGSTCLTAYGKDSNAKSFYVIGFSNEKGEDGHALCVKVKLGPEKGAKPKLHYMDNDKPGTTDKIDMKHKNWTFDVYQQNRQKKDVDKLSHAGKKQMLTATTLTKIGVNGGC